MVRYSLFLLLLMSFVVLPLGWTQDASEANDTPSFEIKYKLILERNIFSRDRQVYQDVVVEIRNDPPPPPVEASFVLVGISRQNDMTVAFFENMSLGLVDRYAVNSQIAQGKIQGMTLDTLAYVVRTDVKDVNAVKVTNVKIGQSLLGEIASVSQGYRGRSRGDGRERVGGDSGGEKEAGDSPPSEGSPADDMSDADMDEVLRKMMERRKSE